MRNACSRRDPLPASARRLWSYLTAGLTCLIASTGFVFAGDPVPLTYDDGARTLCFQHIGTTKDRIKKKRGIEVSAIKGTDCGSLPERRTKCDRGAMWKGGAFLADGTCPAWFVQTYNWTAADYQATPGWNFEAKAETPGTPLLMTITNNASESENACQHHEVNFNYNFPGISVVDIEGRGPRISDFKDVRVSFDARMADFTTSNCEKLKRALVKLSVVLRWYDRGEDGAGAQKYLWQSSIAIILFDADGMMAQIQETAPDTDDPDAVVFDNDCKVHGVWKSGACMISLDGADLGMPALDGTLRRYDISLTDLLNRYRDRLTPPKGLAIEDAEIKSAQIISAVNGADLTFQVQDMRLVGTP